MSNRKIITLIVRIMVILFLGYNLVWYFGCYRVYQKCEKNFPEVADSGVKIYVDEEDFQYSVHKPTYLFFEGNLSIVEKDLDHSLIIWLGFGGKNPTTGVMLTDQNGEMLQIEMKNETTALDEREQKFVDENQDLISNLYEKANEKWELGLT